jgi:hypothetical protein
LYNLRWLIKGAAALYTCREERNKDDLTCIIMIGPSGLLLIVPHLFAVPVAVFIGEVQEK